MKTMKSISVIFILMLGMFILPTTADARVQAVIVIKVRHAPPPLPYYEQPYCPVEGYLWTPGYWAYDGYDYYWVPGQWVEPPHYGYLWTPCYWGFSGGFYGFHNGYWARNVGYYGGVNYGYGYGGSGFYGGRWSGSHFQYNTAVMHVNRNVTRRTYVDRTYVRETRLVNRPSFNGPGGVTRRPSARENVAIRQNRTQPTSVQNSHQQASSKDRNQFVSVNKGRPAAGSINKVNGRTNNSQSQQGTSVSPKSPNRQNNGVGNRPSTSRPTDNGQVNSRKNQSVQPNQGNRSVRQQATPSAPKQQQVNRQQSQPQQQKSQQRQQQPQVQKQQPEAPQQQVQRQQQQQQRQQAAPQQQQRQQVAPQQQQRQQAQPQQQQQRQQAQPQQRQQQRQQAQPQQRQQNDKNQGRN